MKKLLGWQALMILFVVVLYFYIFNVYESQFSMEVFVFTGIAGLSLFVRLSNRHGFSSVGTLSFGVSITAASSAYAILTYPNSYTFLVGAAIIVIAFSTHITRLIFAGLKLKTIITSYSVQFAVTVGLIILAVRYEQLLNNHLSVYPFFLKALHLF